MGVEGQRVVVVTGQGGDGVMVRVGEGVVDRVRQHRIRADLDEGAVCGACGGHRLGEPDRVAQIGRPVVRIEDRGAVGRLTTGGDEHRDTRRLRIQIGEFGTQIRQHRIDDRMMGGDVDVDAPGQPVLCRHDRDHRADLVGRSGDHDLPR